VAEKANKIPKGELFMAYKISDECIQCGACAGQCPVEAISQGDSQYVIDPSVCIDCGACAGQCPVEAIAQA
jgi:ferredoxin